MTTRRTAVPALDGGGSVRQSVALVAALLIGMMFAPVAARAAGTLVSIVDPSTGAKAHVTDGKLQIGDGSGPLTVNGNLAVSNFPKLQPVAGTVDVQNPAGGTLKVDVQNTIGAPVPVALNNRNLTLRPAAAAGHWNNFVQVNQGATMTLFPPQAAATTLAISSLTLLNGSDVMGTATFSYSPTCTAAGGGNTTLTEVSVQGNLTYSQEFTQPLVQHIDQGACLTVTINGNSAMRITGVGFTQ
jgi:hypothetical protein